MATYVCSDIHGQYDLYRRMLKAIQFSDRDRLYVLGDVIDRGPANIKTLRNIMRRNNTTCLLGNHELMMYDHMTGNAENDFWFNGNGGDLTNDEFKSYRARTRNAIMKYIRDMYLQVEVETGGMTFLLSHSSFIPDLGTVRWKDVPYDDAFNSVWNSPWRFFEYMSLEEYKKDGRIHIIGHVPVQNIRPNEWPDSQKPEMPAPMIDLEHHLINIDLGCARLGRGICENGEGLCCVNLDAYAAGDTDTAFSFITPGEESIDTFVGKINRACRRSPA